VRAMSDSKQEIFLLGRDQSCSPRRGRAAASVVTSSLRLLKCCRAGASPASGLGRLSLQKGRGDPDSANDHSQTQSSRETVAYFPESKLLLCRISMEIYGNSQSRRTIPLCL
jgi:hypothetical protein